MKGLEKGRNDERGSQSMRILIGWKPMEVSNDCDLCIGLELGAGVEFAMADVGNAIVARND